MSAVITARPDPEFCSIDELASYYTAHLEELTAVDKFMYRAKRRLGEAVRDQGPIITAAGRVYLESSGTFEYPPEIAQEFPGLGAHLVTALVDTIQEAERLLELITEEVPAAVVGHEVKVDGKRAATQIAKGGEAAHRLLDLRTAKSKLAVA
jgi:hypothetical protein